MAKITTQIIKDRLKALYNDKYDLSTVEYTGSRSKITLICPKHGPWTKMTEKVLGGVGCSKCNFERAVENRSYNRLKTNNQFIHQAKKVHGDIYDYSLVEYKNTDTKVKIICPSHGVFEQLPWGHLKYGCRSCNVHKSNVEKEWLDSIGLAHMIRQRRLPDLNITVDGYDPITNTVYEFYGDYWHGNPARFDPLKINTRTPKQYTFGELYQGTLDRETSIISAGYNLVTIWESDYRKTQ